MTESPAHLDRSRRADFHLSIAVGADEDPAVLGEVIRAMLDRAMLYRQPELAAMRPAQGLVMAEATADRALAEQLQPMSPAEVSTFQLLKARSCSDDGRLLLVRVHHDGRNRALIVLATPAGDGALDLHALAMLADAELVAAVTPTS